MRATDKQQGKQQADTYPSVNHRFQPGQSGNPAGRPKKGDAVADIIAEIMEQEVAVLTGGEASPPGEALKEMLTGRKMSQKELAKQTGLSALTIRGIIRGKTAITPETALRLEKALGELAEFWIRREAAYTKGKRDMWRAIVSRIALLGGGPLLAKTIT